jgi:hypothetical protein
MSISDKPPFFTNISLPFYAIVWMDFDLLEDIRYVCEGVFLSLDL